MCAPGCIESVVGRLNRRSFLGGVGLAAAGAATSAVIAPRPARAATSFERVIDLTHQLPDDFPTYFGSPGISREKLFDFDENGFNLYEFTVNEHTGTHLDAPLHFSADGWSSDEIPTDRLVVPLVVIDIAAKAQDNADYQVTPEDITAWKGVHGDIPAGACVAMHSGWGKLVETDKFRNADDAGVMHFPGFHVEAAMKLIEEHDVVGMAVDSLSLDHGPSQDFATHYAWLPTNRWGIENIAHLDQVPATGAQLVLGAPMFKGGTGGPSRVLALV